MGRCKIFDQRAMFSVAFGLDQQYDIDKIKLQCETYKEEMNEGEQMKWEK